MKYQMHETGGVKGQRKTLWFTPPYNMAVANKLGKEFFRLSKKFSSVEQSIQNI